MAVAVGGTTVEEVLGQIEQLIRKLVNSPERESAVHCKVSTGGSLAPPSPANDPPALLCSTGSPNCVRRNSEFYGPPGGESDNAPHFLSFGGEEVVCEPQQDAKGPLEERTADDSESDSSHDSVFQMHAEWQKRAEEQGAFRISRRKSADKVAIAGLQSGKIKWRRVKWERWRQTWAICSALIILQDCFSIPLLAFGRSPTWFLDVGEAAFWTVNLPVHQWLLVVHDSWLLRQAAPIFCVEAILVAMLYTELLTWEHSVGVGTAVLRGAQLLRVLHLPRYYEWAGLARHVSTWIHRSSREIRALVNIGVSMILGVFFLHVLTCVWFAVGGPTGAQAADISDLPTEDQYRITMEWALSRLHPVRTAENMLLPTQIERLVALLASGMGLLFGSMFASLVTNDLADIRRVRRLQKETEHQISDYLTIFPISWDLEKQLKEFLQTKMASLQPPCKAEISQLLPDFLYHEVCCEALFPILSRHDFFTGLCLGHPAFRHDLCVRGLQDWNVAPHEVLFTSGLKCPSMLVVAHGNVLYSRKFQRQRSYTLVTSSAGPTRSAAEGSSNKAEGYPQPDDPNVHSLPSGHWMCEPCLWTTWQYVGKATADTRTTLLCLSSEALMDVTRSHKAVTAELIIYARLFVSALKDVPEEDYSDLPAQTEIFGTWG